jgi:ATP-dependent Lon protease
MSDAGQKSGASIEIAGELPVLPLRNGVMFPGSILPIEAHRPRTLAAVDRAGLMGTIAIITQRDRADDTRDPPLFDVGCAARILKTMKLAAEKAVVIVQGLQRIRILDVDRTGAWLAARVEAIAEPDGAGDETLLRATETLKEEARRWIAKTPELPREANLLVEQIADAGMLADVLVSHLDLSVDDRQRVLETVPLAPRIELALAHVRRAADS